MHLASSVRDLFCSQPAEKKGWNIQRCIARVAEEGTGAIVLLARKESNDDILHSVDIAMGKKPAPLVDVSGSKGAYLTTGLGSQILRDIGVSKIRLMGAPVKYNALSGFDLEVVEFVAPE